MGLNRRAHLTAPGPPGVKILPIPAAAQVVGLGESGLAELREVCIEPGPGPSEDQTGDLGGVKRRFHAPKMSSPFRFGRRILRAMFYDGAIREDP
jgi:hypothetical protein